MELEFQKRYCRRAPFIRLSSSYFDFSGQTAGPIWLKLGSEVRLLIGNRDFKSLFGHVTLSVSKWQTRSIFGKNRTNSFNNLLLQIHQSECYQIWVAPLGQGGDVKLPRSNTSSHQQVMSQVDGRSSFQDQVARRRLCVRLRSPCLGAKVPCCDPCASCYCRFFNAVCYCRRLRKCKAPPRS
uniref:Agouti domain-containing protein n=1 Tax=Eptatretus burgeri TaxID=7764 RepID=A0A8C4R532_EPTBU